MFDLILTVDYELFGDGSGCIDACVIAPTDEILAIANTHSAPVSFFVDASEFAAIRDLAPTLGIAAVEAQISAAADNGHRIELHLHPQWHGAIRRDDGWKLDYDKWRIGDLSEAEIADVASVGLDYLHSLAPSSDEHCNVFRAGGWAIQPSTATLKVLRDQGILMESTVAHGAYNPAGGDWYDFRRTPKQPFWTIENDVCEAAVGHAGNLIEVPICTAKVSRSDHARALREHRQHASMPEGCAGSYDGPNNRWQTIHGKLTKLARLGHVMLDFSTMPGWLLIEITKDYMQRFSSSGTRVPIVAIAHNKNFTRQSADNTRRWLEWASEQPELQFSDYLNWYRAVTNTDSDSKAMS